MHRRAIASALFICCLTVATASARKIKFAAANTSTTGIDHTSRVAFGDFNNDGNPDIAISSTYNQIAVFIGNGDGTFTGPTIYNLTFYVTGSVVVGDFNNDGNLDLAVVGGDTSGNGLAFLAGNGDGTFSAPVYFPTTLAGASITAVAADFSNDQDLDLFVGGNGSSQVVLGYGNGTFQNGQYEPVYGNGVAAGDFNNDGILDVATTQSYPYDNSTGLSVLLGNGDATFQSPQAYSGMQSPLGIATGDFNGDKILDLAVTDYLLATVDIWQGNGDGTFTNIGQWIAGTSPGSVVVSDFNSDGNADLAVSDYGGKGIVVLPGQGNGTFPAPQYISTGNGPSDLVAVDVNHDGAIDLVVVNNVDNTFSVLLNTAGTYVQLSSSSNPSQAGDTVTFTATVQGSVTTTTVPTGTVIFRDGGNSLGSVALSDGTASFSTSSLSQGTHRITATYEGDKNFNPNRSSSLSQTVQ
jgi:hypothetical protein